MASNGLLEAVFGRISFQMRRGGALVVLAAATLTLAALAPIAPALADGMVTYHMEVAQAEGSTPSATAQRAVLWFRDGSWDVMIQPMFERKAGAAAWIVPFPVVPKVSDANAGLFDALERLTSPVFVPFCYEEEPSSGWFGCAGSADTKGDGSGSRAAKAESDVKVWGSGTTEQFEYVVLSAQGSAALVEWLEKEGYVVPSGITDKPTILDGSFVFAGKLLPDLDPKLPIKPLTFRLEGLDYEEAIYPMKLTALAAPQAGLELILWVVSPVEKDPLVTASVDWLPMPVGQMLNKSQWDDGLAAVRKGFTPRGGLVVEYYDRIMGGLGSNQLFTRELRMPVFSYSYVTPESVGLELPESWPDEIVAMAEGKYGVTRFSGVLKAEAMVTDITFKRWPSGLKLLENIFYEKLPCSDIDGEVESGGLASRSGKAAAVLVLLGILSSLLVVFRRFR